MNCRIVCAICSGPKSFGQFSRKKNSLFKKNENIVILTDYLIHSCPCFDLNLTKNEKCLGRLTAVEGQHTKGVHLFRRFGSVITVKFLFLDF